MHRIGFDQQKRGFPCDINGIGIGPGGNLNGFERRNKLGASQGRARFRQDKFRIAVGSGLRQIPGCQKPEGFENIGRFQHCIGGGLRSARADTLGQKIPCQNFGRLEILDQGPADDVVVSGKNHHVAHPVRHDEDNGLLIREQAIRDALQAVRGNR